jgi:hypothetical protein
MANTDQKLVVTELDFAQIKTNLKNFLRDQSEFTDFDFEASGMSTLLDVLAYNTHYMAYYNNMIANEMFLDTAVLRDSVVSHAKMLGYTPVSSVAPRATVNLQIIRPAGDTTASLTLPRFTRFQSTPLNGISYTFVNTQAKTTNYDPTCNRFCFDDLYIYQGQPLTYTFTYNTTNNPTASFELPDDGIDTNTIEVLVQESSTSLKTERFTLATDATAVTSNAAVYYLDETRNGKYKVYFGDGVLGKNLVNGNIVIINYIRTDGAAANKSNAFSLVDSVGGFTNSIVYPTTAASGGADQESISKIRFSAPKAYVSNNRGVTKEDLIALINKNYPYFEAVNVWGGEENDPPIYGKVFIAAKPTLGFEITESEKLDVINNIIKPVSVVTVIPEFVDVDYNYLNLFVEVFYDATKTTRSADAIKAIVKNAITNYKDSELDSFNSRFKLSRLLRNVDDSEDSISYSDAVTLIEKRFVPQVGAARNYTIDFGTPISREDPSYRIYSTPAFKKYDADGVLRKCFFEETQGTSSGVESIEIVAGTTQSTYEITTTMMSEGTAPFISLNGDGVGANAYPVIVNGKITQIVVDKPGVNYTTATAILYYQNQIDNSATFTVNIQGRYGVLRSYFFDNNNIKTTLESEAGNIDYLSGKITLNQFDPVSIEDPLKIFRIVAKPETNNFESARSRIITIDEEDTNAINITVKQLD